LIIVGTNFGEAYEGNPPTKLSLYLFLTTILGKTAGNIKLTSFGSF